MEGMEMMSEVAAELVRLKKELHKQGLEIPIVFKASFDKANRTSIDAYRGPGLDKGLDWLAGVKQRFGFPLTTDIHEPAQADQVAEVVDIIQIPAFLSRQTDLITAAARTSKIVNIKKGQWMSGHDMAHVVEKVYSVGNRHVLLTERGNYFGYADLIVDFRNISWMQSLNVPVVMDCTHSVQMPPSGKGHTGGNRRFVHPIALAAQAFGARGFFFEVHPDPPQARSDRSTQISPTVLRTILFDLAKRHILLSTGKVPDSTTI